MAGPRAAPRVDLKGVSRVAYSVVERVGHLDDKLADRWADRSAASSVDLKGASKVAYWVVERVGHLDDKSAALTVAGMAVHWAVLLGFDRKLLEAPAKAQG
jgi:hypothetical protein